jgi:hypothetical protein
MKSKFSFVMALTLLIVFCAPGVRGDVNPFYKPQLSLPFLPTPQAPVVYSAGVGYSSFGIKLFGGLSMGSIRNSDTGGAAEFEKYKKSLMGLAGGIGFETGGQVGVEVDLMYVQKGATMKGSEDDGFGNVTTFDVDIVINQIAVPVLLRFKFMPGTSPYILLGGSVCYILSAKANYTFSGGGQSESGSEDLFKADDGTALEILNRLDFGIVGGAGLELAMGTMRLYLEGRYSFGLANILHETQRETGDWLKLSTILILGGIGF